MPVYGSFIGRMPRLRDRSRQAVEARRRGPTLEHAVADHRGGESEGQVGMSTRAEQKNHQSDSDIEGARVIMRIARIAVVSLAVSHPIFAQQGPTASQAAQPQTKL